ncbi:MAG TPA: hypothetical protein VFT51_15770 [Bacillales bacterium]|nr:hypothetical protein [Bacillales bacterium]
MNALGTIFLALLIGGIFGLISIELLGDTAGLSIMAGMIVGLLGCIVFQLDELKNKD